MSLPPADASGRSAPLHQANHGGHRTEALRAAPAEAAVPAGTKAHKVAPGDTLNSIARQHQTTVAKLYEHNPNLDPARFSRTLAQAGDHWDLQYLQDVDTVYVPGNKADATAAGGTLLQMAREFGAHAQQWMSQAPVADPADVAVLQAAQEVSAIEAGPERAQAIADQAHEIEQTHGHDAAVAFVARVVSTDPQGFGASITEYDLFSGEFDAATQALLAEGVSKAYDEAPVSPYTGPGRLAASLIDGLSGSMFGMATSTLLSRIVGGTGNDALQADFVRSGLYQAMENEQAMAGQAAIDWGPVASMIEAMAPATRGSGAAAEEVIRFAEQFDMPFGSGGAKGPEALRTILELFRMTDSPRADGASENGVITFLDAAVSAQGGLGNQQSLTLFLAMAGASTDGTGLLEMDGPGGSSNPAATALTSQLFQQYFERWAADPALKLVIGGDIAHTGVETSPYPGFDFNGAFQNFFKEALLDPNEDGAYRSELLGFVTDTVFRAFDPGSTLVQTLGTDHAATLAGNLLGLLETSQVSLYGDLRSATEQQQRLLTLLSVVSVAAGGAGLATLATGTLAKVIVAGLIEAAKSGGRITVEALAAQGIDGELAQVVAGYANGDLTITQAFADSALFQQLEAAGLGAEELQAFGDHVQSTIGHGGYTLAEAITDAINILDNDVPASVKDRLAEIQRQMQQGIEHQRKAAGE